MDEEGWFKDPYRRHEARWMSDGTPTSLVRDGGFESQDAPPDEPLPAAMERLEVEATPGDRSNLRRADDAETVEFTAGTLRDAAEEGFSGSR